MLRYGSREASWHRNISGLKACCRDKDSADAGKQSALPTKQLNAFSIGPVGGLTGLKMSVYTKAEPLKWAGANPQLRNMSREPTDAEQIESNPYRLENNRSSTDRPQDKQPADTREKKPHRVQGRRAGSSEKPRLSSSTPPPPAPL